MTRFFWICLAGAAGTAVRYGVSVWAVQRFGGGFPYGTLIVNLAGSFAMGALMQAATVLQWPVTLRAALAVGFLGGLTTYSSFNYETTRLAQDGATSLAALNLFTTVVGALAAGWLGMITAKLAVG